MLFDTNGVLDVMLDRAPFADIAAQVFSKGEAGEIGGFLGTTTITTIHYLAAKVVGADQAQIEIGKLFRLFEFAPVNRAVLEDAAVLNFSDFEGAVLHEAARTWAFMLLLPVISRTSNGRCYPSILLKNSLGSLLQSRRCEKLIPLVSTLRVGMPTRRSASQNGWP